MQIYNLFYHELGTKHVIIKLIIFSKEAVFPEKTGKPFVWGHDHFEVKGASGDKNQYKIFCRKRGFKHFSFNKFFEKKQYFPK